MKICGKTKQEDQEKIAELLVDCLVELFPLDFLLKYQLIFKNSEYLCYPIIIFSELSWHIQT